MNKVDWWESWFDDCWWLSDIYLIYFIYVWLIKGFDDRWMNVRTDGQWMPVVKLLSRMAKPSSCTELITFFGGHLVRSLNLKLQSWYWIDSQCDKNANYYFAQNWKIIITFSAKIGKWIKKVLNSKYELTF